MDDKRDKDLIGRPVLSGGAKGEQLAFCEPKDFKTLAERERINAKNDDKKQLKLF